ncbi:MAG: SDR family NAD(P)-dependent oxidoreductase [Verrucomicrobia bacterium]|nr:SDR family NAD(P)-dependent oxidoreductase [Verrucomicrobiota bacterium]
MQFAFQFQRSCALITGASSGLGMEFARQLAPYAATLILVARRGQVLEELKRELMLKNNSLVVHVKEVDLSDVVARNELADWIKKQSLSLNFLINNAGLGDLGDFAGAQWERLEPILNVNITALTHLTHLLLPILRRQAPSAILQVGSVASFFPLPYNAVYAASKAYVKSFSEALAIEEEKYGVFVSLLSPGPVPTPFFEIASRSGEKNRATSRVPRSLITSAEEVVAVALKGFLAHRDSIIPNRNLRIVVKLCSMLPRRILKKLFLLNKNFS